MKYPQLVSGRAVSGVSDWLAAELEALGIDGPLYSRLVLSLLHRPLQINALDFVELHCVSRDREGRRARKRSRPPGSTLTSGCGGFWLGNKAQNKGYYWDPELIKRCAAVECLKTASDQKSDIERLVDELCTKLRDIENETNLDSLDECSKSQPNSAKPLEDHNDCSSSPTDLASKYYAAFPALSGLNQDSEITFYPSYHPCSVWSATIKPRSVSSITRNSFDKKVKMWKETDMDRKTKPISKKSKSRGAGRRHLAPQWDTVWELGNEELLREYINNQCNVRDIREERDVMKIEDNRRLYERDLDDVHFNQEWILEDEIQLTMAPETDIDKISVARFEAKFNQNMEALWKDADDTNDQLKDNECSIDELNVPVDIQELLSSPSDLLFEDAEIKPSKPRGFIQAGTNIINSIWSDNTVITNEEEMADNFCEKSFYPSKNCVDAANEYKHQLEMARSFWESSEIETKDLTNKKSEFKNEFKIIPWQINFSINDLVKNKWSDDVIDTQSFSSLDKTSSKYQVLNHNREISDFHEVIPGSLPFSTIKNFSEEEIASLPVATIESPAQPEEDLLNSARTHFRPIKDDGYADGTTFAIPNCLDKVTYKRSESGTMSLVTEHETKQYMVYRSSLPDASLDEISDMDNDSSDGTGFVIKFCVKQIEKCCQTDDEILLNKSVIQNNKLAEMSPIGSARVLDKFKFSTDYNIEQEVIKCGCSLRHKCLHHKQEPDGFDVEVQKFDVQSWCDKCSNNNNNNNNVWRGNWFKNESNSSGIENLQQIWSSKVGCETCTSVDILSNDTSNYLQLKKELSRDGEEIMSDLSYMQSLYIGSDWADEDTSMDEDTNQDVATSEEGYDVNKVITNCHEIFQLFKPVKTEAHLANYSFQNNESSPAVHDVVPPIAPPESEQWKSGSDRKRRHSSSQQAFNEPVAADCKKPHCKFSHEISSMPCQFWGDSWGQQNGGCGGLAGCSFQHLTSYPRPLTR